MCFSTVKLADWRIGTTDLWFSWNWENFRIFRHSFWSLESSILFNLDDFSDEELSLEIWNFLNFERHVLKDFSDHSKIEEFCYLITEWKRRRYHVSVSKDSNNSTVHSYQYYSLRSWDDRAFEFLISEFFREINFFDSIPIDWKLFNFDETKE